MRLGGRHCSDACSVAAAVLAVSLQSALVVSSRQLVAVCRVYSQHVVVFVTTMVV